jgi:hypothetical protein
MLPPQAHDAVHHPEGVAVAAVSMTFTDLSPPIAPILAAAGLSMRLSRKPPVHHVM